MRFPLYLHFNLPSPMIYLIAFMSYLLLRVSTTGLPIVTSCHTVSRWPMECERGRCRPPIIIMWADVPRSLQSSRLARPSRAKGGEESIKDARAGGWHFSGRFFVGKIRYALSNCW